MSHRLTFKAFIVKQDQQTFSFAEHKVVYSCFFFSMWASGRQVLKRSLFPWLFCVKQKAPPHLSSPVWSLLVHTFFTPTGFKLQQLVQESQQRQLLQINNLCSCSSLESCPAVDNVYTRINSSKAGKGPNYYLPCEADSGLLRVVWVCPVSGCLIIAVTSRESSKRDLTRGRTSHGFYSVMHTSKSC